MATSTLTKFYYRDMQSYLVTYAMSFSNEFSRNGIADLRKYRLTYLSKAKQAYESYLQGFLLDNSQNWKHSFNDEAMQLFRALTTSFRYSYTKNLKFSFEQAKYECMIKTFNECYVN